MKPTCSIALAAALVLLGGAILPAFGQSAAPTQLTPEQRASIREKLKGLIDELKEVTVEKNTSLTSIFMKASESPRTAIAFYLDCVEEVDFRRAGLGGAEFRQWKDNNERRLDNDDFARALQIQLKYLAISTEAARTDDLAKVFPLLTGFVDSVSSMEEIPDPLLNERISQSIFARRYDLFQDREQDRGRGGAGGGGGRGQGPGRGPGPGGGGGAGAEEEEETWELRPLNIGGMYEKTVLPYLHQNTPEKVPGAWAKRIEQEARLATVRGDAAAEEFRRVTYPALQWGMFVDQFKVGYEVESATKMLDHIQAHKGTHPKVDEWIAEMIAVLFPETDSTFKTDTGSAPQPPGRNPLGG